MKSTKQIKVFIQHPLNISTNTYYKYLISDPPKNILYINPKSSQGNIESKTKRKTYDFVKSKIKNITRKFNLSLPNVRYTNTKLDYELIHCAHCMSSNPNPWVADFEWLGQFFISGILQKDKQVLRYLNSPYCKKILCWTNATKKGIDEVFPEIKNKTCVVYPATPKQKFTKIKHDGINLLYVSRLFYEKGGLHSLDVIDKLTKKYKNVYGTIISQVPKEIEEKYSSNKKLNIMQMVKQDKLFNEIYPKSDILIYPGYIDTFGFAMTEAMSFGIPVISVEGFSRSEIVENNKTGFVIKKKGDIYKNYIGKDETNLINEIVNKASILIEDSKLRNLMSKNCLQVISDGKFSIKERNKKISKIYSEAIK